MSVKMTSTCSSRSYARYSAVGPADGLRGARAVFRFGLKTVCPLVKEFVHRSNDSGASAAAACRFSRVRERCRSRGSSAHGWLMAALGC